MNCIVCGKAPYFAWTDTHGVAACSVCGMPYRLFFYDKDGNRIEGREPEPAMDETGIEIAKRYWSEERRRVYPGVFDLGFYSGEETTYSGATHDDVREFNRWYDRHYSVEVK